ncbi:MAG: response regulator [Bacteroidetes bacterium]|jgi:signal transduction histidine kinase/DNA-binding response OmpR family regulator|nr:response regulator [Bacteroidota bacterium]MBT3749137.1 response regulator [Bacteroidota bacterium]MBT4412184.1 response regulator [Bacteroidota bacterium]MBT7093410.1 response regulator [Bacteroidota bacterium]MBT7466309.1 response regulator [Bacteroidota bacterium]
MFLSNIRIGYRLALGFGMVVMITIAIGFVGNRNIDRLWRTTEELYQHPLEVSKAVRDIKINIVAIHRSMKDVALAAGNDLQINQAIFPVDDYEREVYEAFVIVNEQFLGDMADVQKAYDAFINWKPIRDEVIQLSKLGNLEDAADITKGKGASHVAWLNSMIQVMIDFANNKGDTLYYEGGQIKNKTKRNSTILLLVLSLICIVIATLITRSIASPILSMISVSQRQAKGELSLRNENITREETGYLAQSINDLADSIEYRTNIQDGIVEISETMIEATTMEEFGKALLKRLMDLTKASMSVFYILNEVTSEYEHFTSVGANVKLLKSFNAGNPEGEFGNVILKKSIYYLRDIPDDTIFKYKTTAGEAIPKEIITLPILVEGSVVAIVSLVNMQPFSKESYSILDLSWAGINVSYSNLMASERTSILAEQLYTTNQELEIKSEELQEQAEELQRSSEELMEQNLELDEQGKRVESANRMKTEFLSNMSHELRTPLNSILALSRVLAMQANKKLNSEEISFLEIIERNGKRLLYLINDILDLSKIEAGKMEILPESISIRPIVKMVVDSVQPISNKKGIELVLNISGDLPQLETEESKLLQILTNIIGNAVKFTNKGGIIISVNSDPLNMYFTVKDTGIGISNEALPHIFDEFKQADGSTSRSFEGTGLGLAIAKKMTKILGGDIKVSSKLEEGTEFTLTLPLRWAGGISMAKTHVIENVDLIKTQENQLPLDGNYQARILMIEDNPEAIVQVKAVLENENFIVDVAGGGLEAMEHFVHDIPDGIILDLMMPEMDGFDVLEKIRSTNETKNIPVLILTAKDLTRNDLSKLNANNIQQLIQKGDVDIEGLVNKVKSMLGIESPVMTKPKIQKQRTKTGRLNVLIIEDNEDNMLTLKVMLKGKFNLTEAFNGKEGLRMAQTHLPDLILMDMSLPIISGEEILSILKANDETKNILVIAVTAQAMKGDRTMFFEAGCDGYVSKPVDQDLLMTEINVLMNRRG